MDKLYTDLEEAKANLSTQLALPFCKPTRDLVKADIYACLSPGARLALSQAGWCYFCLKTVTGDRAGAMLVISYRDFPTITKPQFIGEFLGVLLLVTGIRYVTIVSQLKPLRFEWSGDRWSYPKGVDP